MLTFLYQIGLQLELDKTLESAKKNKVHMELKTHREKLSQYLMQTDRPLLNEMWKENSELLPNHEGKFPSEAVSLKTGIPQTNSDDHILKIYQKFVMFFLIAPQVFNGLN